MPAVTLIDNYDSSPSTWCITSADLGADVTVHRNDQVSVADILAARPDAIVLSPGPCTPREAGICLDLINAASAEIPIFGVCLGHQAIGEAFGGEVVRAPIPVHGKISEISHPAKLSSVASMGRFAPPVIIRWSSSATACRSDLQVTAETDGLVMALSHRERPTHGVQFHPESIASEHGHRILANFLDLAAAWNKARRGA